MSWTAIRRLLLLKLTGGIPWLVVVPSLAIGIEAANAWFGLAPRLPISFVLMFLSAGSFGLAVIVYAVGCPPELKEITSLEDWSDATTKKRRKILEDLERDKALKAAVLEQAERRIEERLQRAFTNEQISVIKYHFKEGLQTSPNLLGESIGRLSKTSDKSFEQLEKKKPYARLICSILIAAGLCFLTVVIVLRLITVYHATIG